MKNMSTHVYYITVESCYETDSDHIPTVNNETDSVGFGKRCEWENGADVTSCVGILHVAYGQSSCQVVERTAVVIRCTDNSNITYQAYYYCYYLLAINMPGYSPG